MFTIAIIGSGNTAWHMAGLLAGTEHKVVQVCSRNSDQAAEIASFFPDAAYGDSLNALSCHANIYILCVQDDNIESVAAGFPFLLRSDQTLIHTSGAKPSIILRPYAASYGVIWPVQSLVKYNKVITSEVPLAVCGSDSNTIDKLLTLAGSMSQKSWLTDDKKKTSLHLAAVFINNFTNHLYSITKEFCQSEALDFETLYPLLKETALRAISNDPAGLQTGPAKRNDARTIENHLKILQSYPDLFEIYTLFTHSIKNKYSE